MKLPIEANVEYKVAPKKTRIKMSTNFNVGFSSDTLSIRQMAGLGSHYDYRHEGGHAGTKLYNRWFDFGAFISYAKDNTATNDFNIWNWKELYEGFIKDAEKKVLKTGSTDDNVIANVLSLIVPNASRYYHNAWHTTGYLGKNRLYKGHYGSVPIFPEFDSKYPRVRNSDATILHAMHVQRVKAGIIKLKTEFILTEVKDEVPSDWQFRDMHNRDQMRHSGYAELKTEAIKAFVHHISKNEDVEKLYPHGAYAQLTRLLSPKEEQRSNARSILKDQLPAYIQLFEDWEKVIDKRHELGVKWVSKDALVSVPNYEDYHRMSHPGIIQCGKAFISMNDVKMKHNNFYNMSPGLFYFDVDKIKNSEFDFSSGSPLNLYSEALINSDSINPDEVLTDLGKIFQYLNFAWLTIFGNTGKTIMDELESLLGFGEPEEEKSDLAVSSQALEDSLIVKQIT